MLVYQVQTDETVSKSRRIKMSERMFIHQADETVSKSRRIRRFEKMFV